jgi:hypothetical protein
MPSVSWTCSSLSDGDVVIATPGRKLLDARPLPWRRARESAALRACEARPILAAVWRHPWILVPTAIARGAAEIPRIDGGV